MSSEKYIRLGKTELQVSQIGLGIMQWGDVKISDKASPVNTDILDIYRAAIEGGINFFDSAEMYGNGKSELHLGSCIEALPNDIIIATKFMPFPWRLSKGELRAALTRSLKRLRVTHLDLYQIHWPIPPMPIKSWMDAMSDVVADGLIRAVGVSNYSPAQTRSAYEALSKHGITLASNQVKYNLLHRRPENNGLVDLCRDLGVTIIAYSPIGKGILTGKYSPENLPAGYRAWIYNKNYLIKIGPLFGGIRKIGDAHQGKTSAQVALNWLICKGAVPIPGARTKKQAEENAGSLGWQLSTEEVERLDRISDEVISL